MGEILIGCIIAFGIKKFASDLTGFSSVLKISPSTSISERWSVDDMLCIVLKLLLQGIVSAGDDRSKRDCSL